MDRQITGVHLSGIFAEDHYIRYIGIVNEGKSWS